MAVVVAGVAGVAKAAAATLAAWKSRAPAQGPPLLVQGEWGRCRVGCLAGLLLGTVTPRRRHMLAVKHLPSIHLLLIIKTTMTMVGLWQEPTIHTSTAAAVVVVVVEPEYDEEEEIKKTRTKSPGMLQAVSNSLGRFTPQREAQKGRCTAAAAEEGGRRHMRHFRAMPVLVP